jgi:hypothetical protein
MKKAELAIELAASAECLVRQAEQAVEGADGYLARDLAETELQAALSLQDEVLECVAPAIAERERQVRAEVRAALDRSSPWERRARRFLSPAAKSRIIRMIGKRAYERVLPW